MSAGIITQTQRQHMTRLRMQYGAPDKVLVSDVTVAGESFQIMRMDWCEQKRHLFILPDGSRLTWSEAVL